MPHDIAPEENDYLAAFRHDLHAHPELGYQESRTSDRIQQELRAAGVEFRAGLAGGTGVLGFLPATTQTGTEKTIALRADIDALPILEATGKPYSSTYPGRMHACGHDGHTTILLGAARELAKGDRPNHVLLVFQPAEEGGAGGRRMVEDGVLDGRVLGPKADVIFGLHGWTSLHVGTVATKPGPLMAATDGIEIFVHGKGGHAAAPHMTVDPILVGAHLVTALQSVASRTVDPLDSVVVTVGVLEAGTAQNVIPEFARLKVTLRTLRAETRVACERRIREIVDGVCAAFGARAEVRWERGYPVTANDARATAHFFEVARQVIGEANVELADAPVMGGEDFSFYGEVIPACFYWLGLVPAGESEYPSVHTPQFDFNDDAISVGVRLQVALARSVWG